MTVGEKVKMLRESLNMTQKELAKAVGYKSSTTIAKIESGENDPTQKNLMKLAVALGVSPAELLADDDPEPSSPAKTEEARIISRGVDRMPPEDRKRALNMFNLMFDKYDFENEGNDDDEGRQ